jgi:HK97 family phage portal protein
VRLGALFRRAERRSGGLTDPATAALFGALPTASGAYVTPRAAEGLATVLACVSAISSAIGSLPAYVYRRDPAGRAEDVTHPVNRLIRQGPNPWQTWPELVEWLVASALLRGNALAEIETDGRGAVTGLAPIPWGGVSVQLLPSGRLAYDVTFFNGIVGGTGKVRRLLADEVLHLRDRSDDGLIGRSRLARAAETVGAALAVQEFAGAMYRHGVNPSGALQADGRLSDASMARLATEFRNAFAGAGNAAKALVLDQGIKWQQISISPEDAELLASRRFSTEELARIFQVPPPLVGIWDHSSFTNSETAGRWFAQHTLTPWIRKIEAEFGRSVFGAGSASYLELDLSGFLRGDPGERWRTYDIAIRNRVLTPNEIRDAEGWNPRPGGDEFPALPPAAANA